MEATQCNTEVAMETLGSAKIEHHIRKMADSRFVLSNQTR